MVVCRAYGFGKSQVTIFTSSGGESLNDVGAVAVYRHAKCTWQGGLGTILEFHTFQDNFWCNSKQVLLSIKAAGESVTQSCMTLLAACHIDSCL